VDFDVANAVVQDGTLILAITKEGATGFAGTVPGDPQGNVSTAPVPSSAPTTPTAPTNPGSDSGCSLTSSRPSKGADLWLAALCLLLLAARLASRLRS
jgi:hypothetical protein